LIGDNEKITAEKILIASGTRPQIPKDKRSRRKQLYY
jgi:hypothetical protein